MKRLDITQPSHGTVTALAQDLYWARFDLPFRLNHINLYMIDTKEGWVLVDAGIQSEETSRQWQALLAGPLAHQSVAKIIITHHHVDHIGFAGRLQEMTGADVYMSQPEYEKAHWLFDYGDEAFSDLIAEVYGRYGLASSHIELARSDKGRFTRYVAPLPQVQYLKAGEEIKSTHGTWEVRIDQGHSQAHIGLMDKERQLYICVDFLLPRISPNVSVDLRDIDKDMLGAYLAYLKGVSSLEAGWQVFPGHDWPYQGAGERARQLIDHHHERLTLLREAARQNPISVADAMGVLFGKEFEAHELYFASGEARAHLNHLRALGDMVQMQKGGVDYFALSHP